MRFALARWLRENRIIVLTDGTEIDLKQYTGQVLDQNALWAPAAIFSLVLFA